MTDGIQKELFSLQDLKYRELQKKLRIRVSLTEHMSPHSLRTARCST